MMEKQYGYSGSNCGQPARERKPETELSSTVIQTERKSFTFKLAENGGGKFMRIVEEKNGRRDQIVIPQEGREAFLAALAETWSE